MSEHSLDNKVILVTGAARRIGATIVTCLHNNGARVVVHYRSSGDDANALVESFNDARDGSALAIQSNLSDVSELGSMVDDIVDWGGHLDGLVNNASSFYPTPLGNITEEDWDDLIGSNLKGPLFLSQAAAPALRRRNGCIVNIVDVHAKRPLRHHSVYGSAKAGLAMLTRSLAKDLAPDVRVNGVSPGAILWPENGMTASERDSILRQIPLGRPGAAEEIASCVLFLLRDASYVTGQILAVDGGRSIGW